MSNELIFLLTIFIVFGSILLCFWAGGRRWLHAAIVVNLLLISIFGAKLISLFGFITNVGNIFYAGVFLAGQLLVEHYGKNEGKRSVWIGSAAVCFFILIGQITIKYTPIPEAASASLAMTTLFKFAPRIALASLLAYLFSQSLNVKIYSYFRGKEFEIWSRSVFASVGGQLLDSILFFSLAFGGLIMGSVLLSSMTTGFVVKIFTGTLSIPFIYISYRIKTRREILGEESEAILSSIDEGLFVTDVWGKILLVNKSFQEMLGWEPKEVVGRPMTEVIKREEESGKIVPPNERTLGKVLAGEKFSLTIKDNSYFVRKDGGRFPVKITANPVLLDNKIVGAVELFSDITEEKQLEKLRSDFLSLTSHQLRTPLSGTRWIIETLQSGILGDLNEKQKKYLEMLDGTNSQLIRLASDTLEMLQLESDKISIKNEGVSVKRLCEEAIKLFELSVKSKNIKFEFVGNAQDETRVNTDPKIAKRIVESLLNNAIDYSHDGGKISISIEDDKDEVRIGVKDNGIGIPKDEQSKIFIRFYRAANAKKVKTDGTGLGLSISSMLAQKIGAKITFVSKANEGTTFYFTIPKNIKP